ncbi:ABC transporter permease subunit [Aldersonia sp. NBC_00410]|uniref:ABC transporter permease subunit n=1 Tax=Aldersonia sp. NBC_00410 TaxID=2975954 RepID=UPI0022509587|nr:ABC transporter permease subunit [Aldersonia sp. NBC_00410]MCX5042035.1 ABC transporter permease subunit [Aldersonia sp. NBC_00410]
MRTDIAGLDLLLRRRSLLGYAVGMALYTLVIVALYPSFKDAGNLDSFTEDSQTMAALFGITGSLTSPIGWLNANLYNNFLPLILLLLTIGYGASCIAGQDEEETLGVIATLPVSRRRIALEKFGAMFVLTLPVLVVTTLVVLVGRGFDLTVDIGDLLGVTLGTLLLALLYGALAILIGAATGSRGTSLGVASTLAAAGYLINSLAPVVDWLHPAKYLSPFFYAIGDNQLEDGSSLWWLLVLIAVTAALLAAALVAFDRLDIR